jgi:hypothetical protein
VTTATTYHAIRVDSECNAEDFWSDLRERLPHVARSLERNDCAIVSEPVFDRLVGLGAFAGEPSPLIDYGTEHGDVAACRHEVIDE